jgi:hypothetical protein
VGKLVCMIAVAVAAVVCFSVDALADGMMAKRHARKAVVHTCTHGCVVRRPVCPDPYLCSSLYGAYGPHGGSAYWARYTPAGWYQ